MPPFAVILSFLPPFAAICPAICRRLHCHLPRHLPADTVVITSPLKLPPLAKINSFFNILYIFILHNPFLKKFSATGAGLRNRRPTGKTLRVKRMGTGKPANSLANHCVTKTDCTVARSFAADRNRNSPRLLHRFPGNKPRSGPFPNPLKPL